MGLFKKQTNGIFADVIRCDEPSYLIWKWHPEGSTLGKSNRENAIRWGSSLRVKGSEAVVFVHKSKDGEYQDFIVGPYDGILKTENLPVISGIIGLAYGGGTPFQAEVYFINLEQIVQVRFGVPFFDAFDPRFPDFGVPVAVRGTITFCIEDVGRFVQLHRLQNFSVEDFQKQIRDAVCRYTKDTVANAPAAHNIPVVQIESKIAQINDAVEYDLRLRLKEDFGVAVSGVDIGAIEIDKSSDNYAQLVEVTKKLSAATARAQAEVSIKQMQDKQRIEAENYAETLRIQREEAQYAQHKQTQTAHFAAYQTEAQTQVGVAGAEALGKMGADGGNASSGGSGFNPASMMAGLAVGGAVGQNIAATMNSVLSGMNQPIQKGTVPPPIPTIAYHVAVNGQATGPFDLTVLSKMASTGQLSADSLVWKTGMAQWGKAGSIAELKSLFTIVPPIPPDA